MKNTSNFRGLKWFFSQNNRIIFAPTCKTNTYIRTSIWVQNKSRSIYNFNLLGILTQHKLSPKGKTTNKVNQRSQNLKNGCSKRHWILYQCSESSFLNITSNNIKGAHSVSWISSCNNIFLGALIKVGSWFKTNVLEPFIKFEFFFFWNDSEEILFKLKRAKSRGRMNLLSPYNTTNTWWNWVPPNCIHDMGFNSNC